MKRLVMVFIYCVVGLVIPALADSFHDSMLETDPNVSRWQVADG